MDICRLGLAAVGFLLYGAAAFAPGAAAAGPDAPGELFERTLIGPEGLVVRARPEALDLKPGSALRLNVRPEAEPYDGYVTSATDTRLGGRVLRGRIRGTASGTFLVATHGTATAASVWVSPTERYSFAGKTLHEEPASSQVRCACAADPIRAEKRAPLPSAAAVRPAGADAGPMDFDVLVVYTPAALKAEGSADAVAAQAELAMADANACYQNSGIPIHGNVVGVRPVDYTESGEIHTDLHRLATPGDGFLDEVQAMRDAAEADFVCLFTNRDSADGYNGYAEILTGLTPDYEALGFSVVNVTQAAVNHLFAHELGHNMGCDHDRENTTGLRLYDFSYGWRFTGTDGVLYRDVMAYPPGQSIPYFGTPLVSYAGTPTGVADYADTARTLIASAPVFVNFRPADGRPLVSVYATLDSLADLATGQPFFEFERTGSTAAPLTVSYTTIGMVPGDMSAGQKSYRALPGTVTFPAGEHFATQNVHARKSAAPFGEGTVTLTLSPSNTYLPAADPAIVTSGPSATLPLYDRLPLIQLRHATTTADGLHAKFTAFRLGRLDGSLGVGYTLGGTAVEGVDYLAPSGRLTFEPGHAKAEIKIRLLNSGSAVPMGGRTIEMQLEPDAFDYNVAAPGTATFSW